MGDVACAAITISHMIVDGIFTLSMPTPAKESATFNYHHFFKIHYCHNVIFFTYPLFRCGQALGLVSVTPSFRDVNTVIVASLLAFFRLRLVSITD